jgi:ATP-dependent Clp protease ATP-binding subunit ClpA
VLELAMHEARDLDHEHIDNGHILLGLLRAEDGRAARILTERGVTYGVARDAVAAPTGG